MDGPLIHLSSDIYLMTKHKSMDLSNCEWGVCSKSLHSNHHWVVLNPLQIGHCISVSPGVATPRFWGGLWVESPWHIIISYNVQEYEMRTLPKVETF